MEMHRPQFHFTAPKHWMNDPNGLVYFDGEYHLFYQHSPGFMRHAPNSWGHAVATDLVHWHHLAEAIAPDDYGFIWSGSAVVDHTNSSGLQVGSEPPIVAVYTTGGFGSPPTPCVQSLSSSNDRGRTFLPFSGNPVLPHLRGENRDPKVVWHRETEQWIMALYLDGARFGIFSSPDLRSWTPCSEIDLPGTGECPDLFEMPIEDESSESRWVFWGGRGICLVGSFDGLTFTPESPILVVEEGTNGYAAQTWSDIPAEDGRRIQISWMAGGYAISRQPVAEISLLYGRSHTWGATTLRSGYDRPGLFRRYGNARRRRIDEGRTTLIPDSDTIFVALIRGHELCYRGATETMTFLGREITAPPDADGVARLRILVDRTSVEIFAAVGRTSASFCLLPEAADYPLEFYAAEGAVDLQSLSVCELRSALTAK